MASGSIVRLFFAVASVLASCALAAPALAQSVIQRIDNQTLKGAAYVRLPNLTYQQCEERCLKDERCVALEFQRAPDGLKPSWSCALFSATESASASPSSDIGYKRLSTAARDAGTAMRSAKPRQFESLGKEGLGEGGGGSGQGSFGQPRSVSPAPAPAPVAPRSADRAPAAEESAPPARPRVGAARPSPEPPAPGAAPDAGQPRATTRSIRPATTPPPPAADAAPAAAAAPTASPSNERFHIVPVFYGTDRNRVKQEGRFGYANDRAKRLEMGRALVSVPLDHKVPNIERPRAWTIPYIGTFQLEKEDPNRHFTVRELKALSKAELLALVKQRLSDSRTFRNQSIVFIHGYNTSFDDSLFRTAQISYDLQFDGAAYTYSWPSGGGLASYIYDRDSAQGAERYLYEFLQMVQNETGSSSINIIAHSMGNQMLLQVLRTLKLRAPAAVSRINQIILASPDVDRDAFEAIAAEITGVAKGITLYAAANDRALEASRLVAGNKPRAGDVPVGGPVIVAGIDSIDITRLSTSYLAIHQSGYAEHTDLLTDIGQIIRHGTRPWSGRLKAYKPVSVPSGTYWRYEK